MEEKIISLFSVDELAEAMDATVTHRRELRCTGACTDSRKVTESDLFLALIGERFDAHAFLNDVLARGCRAVVVSKAVDVPENCVVFRVDDVEKAFGRLARAVIERRRSLGNFATFGLTGSYGKTTTKELLAALLTYKGYNVLKTEGNFNNFIGLPMTALRLTTAHDVAVFEMGASAPKEIEYLASIAQPEYGLITGVGPVHLQGFGTIEGVAEGKGELIRSPRMKVMALPQAIHHFYVDEKNDQVDLYRAVGKMCMPQPKIPSGVSVTWVGEGADHYFDNVTPLVDGCDFDYVVCGTKHRVHLPLLGGHNASNAALALTLTAFVPSKASGDGACSHGWTTEAINEAVAKVVLPSGRLERWDASNHVIFLHDAYNANPASVKEALALVAQLAVTEHRCLVLGDMLELGETSDEQHLAVGKRVALLGAKRLLCVGSSAVHLREGAISGGMNPQSIFCVEKDNLETGLQWLEKAFEPGDLCLIKGSHGIHLERVLDYFKAEKH